VVPAREPITQAGLKGPGEWNGRVVPVRLDTADPHSLKPQRSGFLLDSFRDRHPFCSPCLSCFSRVSRLSRPSRYFYGIAFCEVIGGGFVAEQSNITPNRAEHWTLLHRSQVPVILVFQSVSLSLKRQVIWPPLEILDQGLLLPG
jgi:hypothetical protein